MVASTKAEQEARERACSAGQPLQQYVPLPLPPELTGGARELLLACWAFEPDNRPSFQAVIEQLEQLDELPCLQAPGWG